MKSGDIKVFRITHISNIAHILKYGITHRFSNKRNLNYTNIGDRTLIDNRKSRKVIVNNGELNNLVPESIILGDFTPFYFGIKMPMLYVIQNGGNFVVRATAAEDIVYLVCSFEKVINQSTEYYFSDGHATDSFTTFYDKSCVGSIQNIIDWDAVKASYWGGQENLNVKRKKQAELLVKGDIMAKAILGFICYNNLASEKLIKLGISSDRIKVFPKAYYE